MGILSPPSTGIHGGKGVSVILAQRDVFDLRKAVRHPVDISPEQVGSTESEVIELVDRLKKRDFAPAPGPQCKGCNVRQLCKYRL